MKNSKRKDDNREVYTNPGNKNSFPSYLHVCASIQICHSAHSNLPFCQLTFHIFLPVSNARISSENPLYTNPQHSNPRNPAAYRALCACRLSDLTCNFLSPQQLQTNLLCRDRWGSVRLNDDRQKWDKLSGWGIVGIYILKDNMLMVGRIMRLFCDVN